MDDIDESEQISEGISLRPQKKGRHRKKQLYQTILQQMEFYFSDANLTKDRFLSNLIKTEPYVDLKTFLEFNKVRSLTNNVKDIAKAVKKSKILQLSEDLTKICRVTPIQVRENVDECTIYVERIPIDMTHDGLSKIFSRFGNVQYVSIPKYKHNKMIKGFAFVEFDTIEAAQKTLDHFASIGCKLPSQMPPDKLYSIATYEKTTNENDQQKKNHREFSDNKNEPEIKMEKETCTTDEMKIESNVNRMEINKELSGICRKRNLSEIEEEVIEQKRIKIDGDELREKEIKDESSGILFGEDDVVVDGADKDDIEDDETNTEKKRRRRKKKTGMEIDIIKEIGLQVLSKREWKRLRNKYLDLQRAKMHSLKAQLYRARFSNPNGLALQNINSTPNHQNSSTSTNQIDYQIDTDNIVEKKKFIIESGTVVHMQFPEPCIDFKSLKAELKSYSNDIKFVDIKEGSFEAYVRFSTSETAKKFIDCPFPATMEILEGDRQKRYFEKAEMDREIKFKKCAEKPKLRGRDKLLKKVEKELGKHIRFDETE